jgi:putative ABC transport system substrate-binding protein
MKRREFIAGLGSAAAWPVVVRAQQPVPVIGWLGSGSPDVFTYLVRAFRRGLSEGGFVEGRNVAIEYNWANDELDRLPGLAADLALRRVNLVVASGTAAARAAKAASATIPVVFQIGSDPVQDGPVGATIPAVMSATGWQPHVPSESRLNKSAAMLRFVRAKVAAALGLRCNRAAGA